MSDAIVASRSKQQGSPVAFWERAMPELRAKRGTRRGLDWPEAFNALGLRLTGTWIILLAYGVIRLVQYAL